MMRSSGFSAFSRLFSSMRRMASWRHPLHRRAGPRAARTRSIAARRAPSTDESFVLDRDRLRKASASRDWRTKEERGEPEGSPVSDAYLTRLYLARLSSGLPVDVVGYVPRVVGPTTVRTFVPASYVP